MTYRDVALSLSIADYSSERVIHLPTMTNAGVFVRKKCASHCLNLNLRPQEPGGTAATLILQYFGTPVWANSLDIQ